MFPFETSVRLYDTDAAGVLFFGNYFKIAHDAYETFMESIDYSLRHVIEQAASLLLIVHSEADFKKEMRTGEKVLVQLRLEKLGKTSFTLSYALVNARGDIAATLKTVHVAVDKNSRRSVELPRKLREGLSRLSPAG